jgi:Tfp pilus assembly protein PilN
LIKINLNPGTKKSAGSRRRLSDSFSGFGRGEGSGGSGGVDRWVAGTVLGGVGAFLVMAFLFFSASSRHEELTLMVQEQASDSARYAEIIANTEMLQARRDSIAQRVQVIQEIDRDRYLWPHVMDEIARALPAYVWLSGLTPVGMGEGPRFQLSGLAGTNLALTTFMESLEASLFVQNVAILSTTQSVMEDAAGRSRVVHEFQLEAEYEYPPAEMIETVPLFGGSENQPEPVADGSDQGTTASPGV